MPLLLAVVRLMWLVRQYNSYIVIDLEVYSTRVVSKGNSGILFNCIRFCATQVIHYKCLVNVLTTATECT